MNKSNQIKSNQINKLDCIKDRPIGGYRFQRLPKLAIGLSAFTLALGIANTAYAASRLEQHVIDRSVSQPRTNGLINSQAAPTTQQCPKGKSGQVTTQTSTSRLG